MFNDGISPLIVTILMAQSLFFAGWVVASVGILWAILRRARSGGDAIPGTGAQVSAVQSYMRDPETRFRRWVWLGLTFGLLGIAFGFGVLIRSV
ncbi:hypothetical protein [Jannaschia pohangensis]|uniref:Uncharacterized protein n=1 Tax=Jannaschia pohangensis TaxID=390807 RepID=A0A1I3Q0X4_9RHOB|nr:hypothetical protein [Jannaschia pohangensis]SFJ27369.1 hypothetical protein SAMN04488095_2375 [Jannaschia pohangensis]